MVIDVHVVNQTYGINPTPRNGKISIKQQEVQQFEKIF